MKKLGRKKRPFFRICAVDSRRPRDGRVLEELGTYDPMLPETDARAILKGERIDYWLNVGAQPSVNVKVLIKKYGTEGTHLEEQKAALERLKPKPRPVVAIQPDTPVEDEDQETEPEQSVAETAAAEPEE
ncbi:MAG: 30S ribosomal protein S16 [Planctomycetaceae bacterium]|jgi:small subunit ribosomal protein S16|nr:30S ribosomal protein S16 [Planctomycetaceae bacterium]MBP63871.1 30S ribosomal protein S16 [Planctomycetaceae bacterium]